jgi:hypothetical protein
MINLKHPSIDLIEQAVELINDTDELERMARTGHTVNLHGVSLRGEDALRAIDVARAGAMLPLVASLALNAERIADALATLAGRGDMEDGRPNLDPVPDSALIAELARRHHPDGLPA